MLTKINNSNKKKKESPTYAAYYLYREANCLYLNIKISTYDNIQRNPKTYNNFQKSPTCAVFTSQFHVCYSSVTQPLEADWTFLMYLYKIPLFALKGGGVHVFLRSIISSPVKWTSILLLITSIVITSPF